MSGKYSQKLLDHAKQSAKDKLKSSSKRVLKKTVKATSDLIGNKITNEMTKLSKTSQQNNSDAKWTWPRNT